MGCNQNRLTQNEIEILSDNFVSNILGYAPLIDKQKTNRSYVQIINEIATDVRNNNQLTTTKKEIVEIVDNLISAENIGKLSKREIIKEKE